MSKLFMTPSRHTNAKKNIAPLCHTYSLYIYIHIHVFGTDNMPMTGHFLGPLTDLCPTKEHRHKNLCRHCHIFECHRSFRCKCGKFNSQIAFSALCSLHSALSTRVGEFTISTKIGYANLNAFLALLADTFRHK